jgi:hypothetical protein
MKKLEVTQVGAVQRNVITWMDKAPTERWHLGQMIAYNETDDGSATCIPESSTFAMRMLITRCEPASFSFVSPTTYMDTVSYNGMTCYHYKGNVIEARGNGITYTWIYEAWIDKATNLPVALDDGRRVGTFTFQKGPPKPPLTPPPDIQEAIDRISVISIPPRKTPY